MIQYPHVLAYKPDGDGTFDSTCLTNYNNSKPFFHSYNIHFYMQPQPLSKTKSGLDQFNEMIFFMHGVPAKYIWIQVVDKTQWSSDTIANRRFINDILAKQRKLPNMKPAIYTSKSDWSAITGDWQCAGFDVFLWYYHVTGAGAKGETAMNFADFAPFGAWVNATFKQYSTLEVVGGITLNRNISPSVVLPEEPPQIAPVNCPQPL